MPLTEHVDVFTAAATTHILSTLEGALVEAVDHATHTTIYATATADANGAATLTIDPPRVYCLRIDGVIAASDHQYGSGEQPRPPGVVIAASNASLLSRAWADRVCTGTNDDVDIQWGIDTGTPVYLSEGTFSIGTTVTKDNGVDFWGAGAFLTFLTPQAGFSGPVLRLTSTLPALQYRRDYRIGNFSIQHDRSFACDGMYMDRQYALDVESIYINGFLGYGLRLSTVLESTFLKVYCEGNGHLDTTNGMGTATAGGATTLTDAGKAWTVNGWDGYLVTIRTGTGHGQTRWISSNTATVLTVSAWTTQPDATSVYLIDKPNLIIEGEAGHDSSNNLDFFGGSLYGGHYNLAGNLTTSRQIVIFGQGVGAYGCRKIRFYGVHINSRITGGNVTCDMAYCEDVSESLFNGTNFAECAANYTHLRFDSTSTSRGNRIVNNTFYAANASVICVSLNRSAGTPFANYIGGNFFHLDGATSTCVEIGAGVSETVIMPNTTTQDANTWVTDSGIRTRNNWNNPNRTRPLLDQRGHLLETSIRATSPALNGATTDIDINIPSGAQIIAVQWNVDTAVTGCTSISAALVGGSATSLGTLYGITQNAKMNYVMTPPERLTAVTDIRLTAVGAPASFTAGVITAIAYYKILTSMADVA